MRPFCCKHRLETDFYWHNSLSIRLFLTYTQGHGVSSVNIMRSWAPSSRGSQAYTPTALTHCGYIAEIETKYLSQFRINVYYYLFSKLLFKYFPELQHVQKVISFLWWVFPYWVLTLRMLCITQFKLLCLGCLFSRGTCIAIVGKW